MPDIHFHALSPTRARIGEDPLIPFLHGARNEPVTLSLRDVRRPDAYRLQILLVAQGQWRMDGADFRVTDIAPAFRDGLARLGIPSTQFDEETQQ